MTNLMIIIATLVLGAAFSWFNVKVLAAPEEQAGE